VRQVAACGFRGVLLDFVSMTLDLGITDTRQ
jgi:hypothetical protein